MKAICEHCGKEFKGARSGQGKPPKFCSKKCFNDHRTEQRPICLHCGKRVPPQNQKVIFCSIKCRVEHSRPAPRNCVNCGTLFSPIRYYNPNSSNSGAKQRRRTCSDRCRDEWKVRNARDIAKARKPITGPDHHLWKGGTSVFWGRGPEWFRISEKVRDRDKRTCQKCGKSEHDNGRKLDVHHIIPFHDINNTKKANRLKNLISLCQSCHTTEDRKINHQQITLPFADIIKVKRRAERSAAK